MNELTSLLQKVLPEKKQKVKKQNTLKLPGEQISENIFLLEQRYSMQKILELPFPSIFQKYYDLTKLQLEDLIFIDTETTGLGLGTGTYIFLIGIGYFQNGYFIIQQYFMSDLKAEGELLNVFLQKLKDQCKFVCFNGKSYDLPLLDSRLTFNEILRQIKDAYQIIDLLHLSRRLWQNRLENCRLITLEKELLHQQRKTQNEIEGRDIPEAYFRFLDTGESENIEKIIQHNRQDVLSLLKILKYINECLFKEQNIDLFQLAKIYVSQKLESEAERIFQKLLREKISVKAVRRELANVYKRQKRNSEAVTLWKQAAIEKEIYAFIELAKWEEHHNKNFKIALKFTDKAIQSCNEARIMEKLLQRKKRLLKKLK